jgi:aryl-alcohol dehydrogenase-like predicted oxidoreductase
MERRNLGQLEVSAVGLGTNTVGTTFFGSRVDAAATRGILDTALEAGINFIDTADVYGDSEQLLGEALQGRRDQVVIATKFGAQGGASAEAVANSVESSLKRLRTDRIDLYQLHRPDPDVPMEETLTALDKLVRDGKVLEIGCSNLTADQLDQAASVSATCDLAHYASVQNELSVLRPAPAKDVLPACERLDVAFIPYSPLAGGLLTGKYQRGRAPSADTRLGNLPTELAERSLSERSFNRVEALEAFARERGHTLIELAFGWLLAQPAVVSVISGVTRPDQVQANVAAAGWVLTSEEAAQAAALAVS